MSWACAYTERLFSRKQRARTSGLSTVVHESTASARYHILTFERLRVGRPRPTHGLDPAWTLQAVAEYYLVL